MDKPPKYQYALHESESGWYVMRFEIICDVVCECQTREEGELKIKELKDDT